MSVSTKTVSNQAGWAGTRAFPENDGNALVWYVLAVRLAGKVRLAVLANQAAQEAGAFCQRIEHILMNLEDLIQLASFAGQLGDVLNVARVIHHIFHQLE